MLGRDGCKEILKKVLGWSRADQAEALIIAQDISLTRFCNSAINQNVSENRVTLFILVVIGRWIGSASTHIFDDQAIQRGLERAQLHPSMEDLRFLPRSKPLQPITSFYNKYDSQIFSFPKSRESKGPFAYVRGSYFPFY